MTIVVTGASGFLGSALVKRLSSDNTPTVAVGGPRGHQPELSNGVTWLPYLANLSDLARQIAETKPSVVVHCATHYVLAHEPRDIQPIIDANLHFGTHILESLSATGTLFVNLSTYFQHQQTSSGGATSLYAVSKSAFSRVVEWYGANTNINVSDLTLFDTYGPGDRRRKLIPSLLACAWAGDTLELRSASAVVDVCYVDDVVSAITSVIEEHLTGSWSIHSRERVIVGDIARVIERVTGRRIVRGFQDASPVSALPLEVPPMLTGWQPRVDLLEGITRCWKAMPAVT